MVSSFLYRHVMPIVVGLTANYNFELNVENHIPQRKNFKNHFPFTTALRKMEILNRAVFNLEKKHYSSKIGSLEPLTLEIYLAKIPWMHVKDVKSREVYASYFNLINSKALFSKVVVGSTISEDKNNC